MRSSRNFVDRERPNESQIEIQLPPEGGENRGSILFPKPFPQSRPSVSDHFPRNDVLS